MSKQIHWLRQELDGWVDRGLVTPEQAGQIRQLYPEPRAGLPWGTIIFSGLGAVITGLGIILVLAYNWEAMPKAAKLAIILLALAGAHAAAFGLSRSADWKRSLSEPLNLLGTMLFGAGIWLVAQLYHIEEHFPNGFLLWGLGALAMAWAMPSAAQGLLAAVLLTIWNGSETWGYDSPRHWGPLVLLAGVGTLAWRRQAGWLLCFALVGFLITVLANAGAVRGSLVVGVALNLSALFLAVGLLSRRHPRFSESAAIWTFFGWLGFLGPLFLLTFGDVSEDLLAWRASHLPSSGLALRLYAWVPFALAMAGWLRVGLGWWNSSESERKPSHRPLEILLMPLTVIFVQVFSFAAVQKWVLAVVFNLVFLALTAAWMSRGCREGSLRHTLLGSLMFAALALARYFDLFDNLVARGLLFVVAGAILFAEGILFTRARRRGRAIEAEA